MSAHPRAAAGDRAPMRGACADAQQPGRRCAVSPGTMIATPVPGPRWLFVLLIPAVATAVWRAWTVAEPAPADAASAEVRSGVRPLMCRYASLANPFDDAITESRSDHAGPRRAAPARPELECRMFLTPILEHPRRQLRITVHTDCPGGEDKGDFSIASTGEVTWTKRGWPVRHLALSSEQRARVRRLDQLSCFEERGLPPARLATDLASSLAAAAARARLIQARARSQRERHWHVLG